jgi:hypothetical protein
VNENVPDVEFVSDGDSSHRLGPRKRGLLDDLPIVHVDGPYDESKCHYVWADTIMFSVFLMPQTLRC